MTSVSAPPPVNRFGRLAMTHALMVGGDAAMVVALADSFFFSVDPSGARSNVLAFLLVSFAPFLLVAPFVGPMIDRVRGGRRAVIQIVAATRVAVLVAMFVFVDSPALFGFVFVALVLQKSYAVSKSAMVPAVVNSERQLVEANAKLGLVGGIAGGVVVAPAALLQLVVGSRASLAYSACVFAAALISAFRLPYGDPSVDDRPSAASNEYTTTSIQVGWAAMVILRAVVGFMLFLLAFWFRSEPDGGTKLLGLAVAASAAATLFGNAVSPRLGRRLSDERMLTIALIMPALAGLAAAIVGGPAMGIVLAAVVNLSAAFGRLSFESTVQREGPGTNRGAAFAAFETRFQLGWVVAGVLPVLFSIPATTGYVLITVVAAVAAVNYRAELRAGAGRRSFSRRRRGRSTSQVPQSHSESAAIRARSAAD